MVLPWQSHDICNGVPWYAIVYDGVASNTNVHCMSRAEEDQNQVSVCVEFKSVAEQLPHVGHVGTGTSVVDRHLGPQL